jgi:hypothetical protein
MAVLEWIEADKCTIFEKKNEAQPVDVSIWHLRLLIPSEELEVTPRESENKGRKRRK